MLFRSTRETLTTVVGESGESDCQARKAPGPGIGVEAGMISAATFVLPASNWPAKAVPTYITLANPIQPTVFTNTFDFLPIRFLHCLVVINFYF